MGSNTAFGRMDVSAMAFRIMSGFLLPFAKLMVMLLDLSAVMDSIYSQFPWRGVGRMESRWKVKRTSSTVTGVPLFHLAFESRCTVTLESVFTKLSASMGSSLSLIWLYVTSVSYMSRTLPSMGKLGS